MKDAPLFQAVAPGISDDTLLQRISDPVFILLYPDAVIIQVNQAAARLLGYTDDELLLVPLSDLIMGGATSLSPLLDNLSHASVSEGTLTLLDRNTVAHTMSVSADLFSGKSNTEYVRLIARATAIDYETPELPENWDRLIREALDAMPIFLWIYAPAEEKFIYVSPAFERIYGYDHLSLYREPGLWFSVIHPDDRDDIVRTFKENVGASLALQYRIIQKKGAVRWVSHRVFPIRDEKGGSPKLTGFIEDITMRRQWEDVLKQASDEWRITFDSITDLVSIHDREFRIVKVNRAFADAFHKEPRELIGIRCFEVIHHRSDPCPDCPHIKTIRTKKPACIEMTEPARGGAHLLISTAPILDAWGEIRGSVHTIRDITERKKMEDELIRLSTTDSLTGLYNQRSFFSIINTHTVRATRLEQNLSLIVFDLDRFKQYNDIHGHLAGDVVLKTVGEITAACIREEVDAAFRYGGDEFAVILTDANESQAHTVARRIQSQVVQTIPDIGVSFGVSQWKPGDTTDVFIERADTAMYAYKTAQRQKSLL
ncbi:MAG: diguanylate cyclase [Deltaproteobacteria bacterium]|nr:diguanylate cyclase [Candidatus Zymogenaceae bacterium]